MSMEADRVGYRKPYQTAQSRWWWLHNRFYLWYMVRESTAVIVLMYCLTLMLGLLRLTQGEAAWQSWLAALNHPAYIVFHLLALLAALYHAHTWFRLAPKIMVLRIGDWTLPQRAMLIGQWVGLIFCTTLLLYVALGWGA